MQALRPVSPPPTTLVWNLAVQFVVPKHHVLSNNKANRRKKMSMRDDEAKKTKEREIVPTTS